MEQTLTCLGLFRFIIIQSSRTVSLSAKADVLLTEDCKGSLRSTSCSCNLLLFCNDCLMKSKSAQS